MYKAFIYISFLFAVFNTYDACSQATGAAATQPASPSTLEINNGLKQALELSTSKSADQLSAVNGFFANAAVKILFPPEAQKAERTLRGIGLGKLADNVILSLNRAAENAAGQAKPIFLSAIKQMTLKDVTGILLGGSDAATQYFKRATTAQLAAKFKPVIQTSLNKTGATKYYADAAIAYNRVPFSARINPDISNYVTQKAIDGLFIEIAQQELSIRQDPVARTTSLLQKVFSYADKKK